VSPDRWPAPDRETGAPALVVGGLAERFGDRVACRDVSFGGRLRGGYGERFGFLGPTGAGKPVT
jgi:ABC-type Na+ transport system ATPase subunit NatA